MTRLVCYSLVQKEEYVRHRQHYSSAEPLVYQQDPHVAVLGLFLLPFNREVRELVAGPRGGSEVEG